MIAITSAPCLYWPSSDASGRFTLMTMSASLTASALTVAPAAVNSESGRPDLMPAPGSTATSTPNALNFFTVSGEAATRGSAGSISLATAIFMRPPAAGTHAIRLALLRQGWIPVLRRALMQVFPSQRAVACNGDRSGQEDRHQDENEGDARGAILHELDEALIGCLMGFVVVAVGGRIGHFAMVCHCCPQSIDRCEELAQTGRQGNAPTTRLPRPIRSFAGAVLGPAGQPLLDYLAGSAARYEPGQPMVSSSSIMPEMTDKPPSQNFGSLASSPNGCNSSE